MLTQLDALIRGIVSTEQFRLVWTVLGGLGTVLFLVLAYEARMDQVALVRSGRATRAGRALYTKGELQDLAILAMVIGCMGGAGMVALLTLPLLAIMLLVASECLLVALGVLKLVRRRKMMRLLRMTRVEE